MTPTIHVVKARDSQGYLLRVHLRTREGETIRFQTGPEFTKREADYRAIGLCVVTGWEHEGLPVHPEVEADSKDKGSTS